MFTNLDLKNANSQLSLDNFTSSQCNFSLVGGNITGLNQFLTGFYNFGDMLNEFLIVMDSKIGNFPFKNCYLDDILVASKGGFTKHQNIVHKILSILDNFFLPSNNQNVNSSEKIGCLGFRISKSGIAPLIDKTKALKDISIPKNLKEISSFFGSTNQYINFFPKLASLGSPLRLLINKKSTFSWNKERTKTFEKIK